MTGPVGRRNGIRTRAGNEPVDHSPAPASTPLPRRAVPRGTQPGKRTARIPGRQIRKTWSGPIGTRLRSWVSSSDGSSPSSGNEGNAATDHVSAELISVATGPGARTRWMWRRICIRGGRSRSQLSAGLPRHRRGPEGPRGGRCAVRPAPGAVRSRRSPRARSRHAAATSRHRPESNRTSRRAGSPSDA